MKELFAAIDKVRWHLRYDKIPSFTRLLKTKLASVDIANTLETYMSYDRIMRTLGFAYLFQTHTSDANISTMNALLISLEQMVIQEKVQNYLNFELDRNLYIIRCAYVLRNTTKVLQSYEKINFLTEEPSLSELIQKYPKSTILSGIECFLCITHCFLIENPDNIEVKSIKRMLELVAETLCGLIKIQEVNVVKKVKTSSNLYPYLVRLLFLSLKYLCVISVKYKYDYTDSIPSIFGIIQNINLSITHENAFILKGYKLSHTLNLHQWKLYNEKSPPAQFSFHFKSSKLAQTKSISYIKHPFNRAITLCLPLLTITSSKPHYNLSLAEEKTNLVRQSLWFALSNFILFLSQSQQNNILATLLLKYLPTYFENDQYYLVLSCCFFNSNLICYAIETCVRTLEFGNVEVCKILLLNIRINVSHSYKQAIDEATDFLSKDPENVAFYHARAVAYLEKSIESLSFSESLELLELAKNDVLAAIKLDDGEFELYYYASIIFAMLDDHESMLHYAIEAAKRALFDSRPYHLLFLVFVARRHYEDALKILNDSEKEFPFDFSMILNRINFEHQVYGADIALNTTKIAIKLWKDTFKVNTADPKSPNAEGDARLSAVENRLYKPRYDKMSLLNDNLSSSTTKSSSSSDLKFASKFQEFVELASPDDIQHATILLLSLYKKMAEIYMEFGDEPGLRKCCEDVCILGYACPESFLIQSYLYYLTEEYDQIKICLETALCMESNHPEVLFRLINYYFKCYNDEKSSPSPDLDVWKENLVLAEEISRRFVKVSPKNLVSWQCLGKILFENGNFEESSYCLKRSIELEAYSTILPFSTLYRKFKPSDMSLQ